MLPYLILLTLPREDAFPFSLATEALEPLPANMLMEISIEPPSPQVPLFSSAVTTFASRDFLPKPFSPLPTYLPEGDPPPRADRKESL